MPTISIVRLNPEAVKKLFTDNNTSVVGVNALYHTVIPDLDKIESIEGYPVCSPETWQAICRLIMDCDGRRNRELPYDKQFMPGGIWLNSGFSTRDDLGLALWEVLPVPPEKIKYKEKC